MRCPKCNNDQKYKDGMTCQKCSYGFIFNPKSDDTNDYKFKLLVDKLENDVSVKCYTINQLHTILLNRSRIGFNAKTILPIMVVSIFLVVFFSNLPASSFPVFFLIFLVILGIVGYNIYYKTGMKSSDFKSAVGRWKGHNPMRKLLIKPGLQTPPPDFDESDIYSYGVEGILIVDQDIYVDLIVKNEFHLDWKVVVMSQNCYPSYLKSKVQAVIDQNEAIKVYYLHDMATTIDSMKKETRTFLKMPADIEELDLGFSVAQNNKIKLFRRGDFNDDVKVDHLPPKEMLSSMRTAMVGGLLLEEVLRNAANDNFISDFG